MATNKPKQATLFQSWGGKSQQQSQPDTNKGKPSQDNVRSVSEGFGDAISLLDDDDEEDQELARALEESLAYHQNSTSNLVCNADGASTSAAVYNEECNDLNISFGIEDQDLDNGVERNNCLSQWRTSDVPVGELPGFDLAAGNLWIYPTNYPVREYQFAIVQKALLKNTLVVLPTGLGKTFIAAVLMYNFYRWYPGGKIVFMAPTKPLVAQQIEACYNIMGIPCADTAEMTGSMHPTKRQQAWRDRRIFFLTPQVMTNDLSRGTCSAELIKCLVVDEAHKAMGNHAYCQVVRELIKYTRQFRILALSATPGSDIKSVQNVVSNLAISHIELRLEESADIKPYTHERTVDKIVVPLGDELNSIKDKYIQVLSVLVKRLIHQQVLYKRETTSLSKFLILKARDAFRQNPPHSLPRQQYGIVEGDFALAMSLYHGFELLQLHGLRSAFNFLDGIVNGDKGYGRNRAELMRNSDFTEIMDILREKFMPRAESSTSSKPAFLMGHPKLVKLQEVVLEHFHKFEAAGQATRVMIFSQYRDSVQEIMTMLQQHQPLVKVMSFIGQSSAGKATKGFTQKEQLQVMRAFRTGGYNTLVSTCVGEEGLDIGDVDLIVCFDAHKSPIRLVQRMGRTGRKRQGRIVMLVTEGKEEQIYNTSQYSKRAIHRAIQNGTKTLVFYACNPRMVPADLTPACHRMHITVQQQPVAADKKKGKAKGTVPQIFSKSNTENKKSIQEEAGISLEEFAMLKSLGSAVVTKHLPAPKMVTLEPKDPVDQSAGDDSTELNVSEWLPWQNTLQPTSRFGHSRRSEHLVELLEFIDLQQMLPPGEDNYGQEMKLYLDMDDVISDVKRPVSSDITQFLVQSQRNEEPQQQGNERKKRKLGESSSTSRQVVRTKKRRHLPPIIIGDNSDDSDFLPEVGLSSNHGIDPVASAESPNVVTAVSDDDGQEMCQLSPVFTKDRTSANGRSEKQLSSDDMETVPVKDVRDGSVSNIEKSPESMGHVDSGRKASGTGRGVFRLPTPPRKEDIPELLKKIKPGDFSSVDITAIAQSCKIKFRSCYSQRRHKLLSIVPESESRQLERGGSADVMRKRVRLEDNDSLNSSIPQLFLDTADLAERGLTREASGDPSMPCADLGLLTNSKILGQEETSNPVKTCPDLASQTKSKGLVVQEEANDHVKTNPDLAPQTNSKGLVTEGFSEPVGPRVLEGDDQCYRDSGELFSPDATTTATVSPNGKDTKMEKNQEDLFELQLSDSDSLYDSQSDGAEEKPTARKSSENRQVFDAVELEEKRMHRKSLEKRKEFDAVEEKLTHRKTPKKRQEFDAVEEKKLKQRESSEKIHKHMLQSVSDTSHSPKTQPQSVEHDPQSDSTEPPDDYDLQQSPSLLAVNSARKPLFRAGGTDCSSEALPVIGKQGTRNSLSMRKEKSSFVYSLPQLGPQASAGTTSCSEECDTLHTVADVPSGDTEKDKDTNAASEKFLKEDSRAPQSDWVTGKHVLSIEMEKKEPSHNSPQHTSLTDSFLHKNFLDDSDAEFEAAVTNLRSLPTCLKGKAGHNKSPNAFSADHSKRKSNHAKLGVSFISDAGAAAGKGHDVSRNESLFTFTQAMDCVHSLSASHSSEDSQVDHAENKTSHGKRQAKVPAEQGQESSSLDKPQEKEELNEGQGDAGGESPNFDLGFDFDEDIIPPSPESEATFPQLSGRSALSISKSVAFPKNGVEEDCGASEGVGDAFGEEADFGDDEALLRIIEEEQVGEEPDSPRFTSSFSSKPAPTLALNNPQPHTAEEVADDRRYHTAEEVADDRRSFSESAAQETGHLAQAEKRKCSLSSRRQAEQRASSSQVEHSSLGNLAEQPLCSSSSQGFQCNSMTNHQNPSTFRSESKATDSNVQENGEIPVRDSTRNVFPNKPRKTQLRLSAIGADHPQPLHDDGEGLSTETTDKPQLQLPSITDILPHGEGDFSANFALNADFEDDFDSDFAETEPPFFSKTPVRPEKFAAGVSASTPVSSAKRKGLSFSSTSSGDNTTRAAGVSASTPVSTAKRKGLSFSSTSSGDNTTGAAGVSASTPVSTAKRKGLSFSSSSSVDNATGAGSAKRKLPSFSLGLEMDDDDGSDFEESIIGRKKPKGGKMQYSDGSDSASTDAKSPFKIPFKKTEKPKKKKRGCAFLDDEAELSDDINVSSDEADDDLEMMEGSFIDNASQMTQATQIDMQAVYMKSVLSPDSRPGAARGSKFRLQYDHAPINVYSQLPRHEEEESQYQNDSFCVESDEEESDYSDTGSEEDDSLIAERHKKKKKKSPPKKRPAVQQMKGRKRVHQLADSSDEDSDSHRLPPSQISPAPRSRKAAARMALLSSSDDNLDVSASDISPAASLRLVNDQNRARSSGQSEARIEEAVKINSRLKSTGNCSQNSEQSGPRLDGDGVVNSRMESKSDSDFGDEWSVARRSEDMTAYSRSERQSNSGYGSRPRKGEDVRAKGSQGFQVCDSKATGQSVAKPLVHGKDRNLDSIESIPWREQNLRLSMKRQSSNFSVTKGAARQDDTLPPAEKLRSEDGSSTSDLFVTNSSSRDSVKHKAESPSAASVVPVPGQSDHTLDVEENTLSGNNLKSVLFRSGGKAGTAQSGNHAESVDSSDQFTKMAGLERGKLVVLVDSREISGAQDIVSALRLDHNAQVCARQLAACDYVLSNRLAVDRLHWSGFSSGANRGKLVERVRQMQALYDRRVIIVERDRIKPGEEKNERPQQHSKYVDTLLAQLNQIGVRIFFTDNQVETAGLLAQLTVVEQRKGMAITAPVSLSPDKEQVVKFYLSIPRLTVTHALNLTFNFSTIRDFMNSSVKAVQTKGHMSFSRATEVVTFVRRRFSAALMTK